MSMPLSTTRPTTIRLWSFRPINGGTGWGVYRIGERSHWSRLGSLRLASDGTTCLVRLVGKDDDARPTLASAVDLVVALLAGEPIPKE